MGRKPKPATILMRQGTYRPGRHGLTPKAIGEPLKPAGLSAEVSAIWDRVVDRITENGAGEADSDCLLGMCEWFAEYRRCARTMVALTPMDGDYKQVAYLTANAWRQFVDMASRFGMTPTDRMKLKEQSDAVPSALDQMLGKRS